MKRHPPHPQMTLTITRELHAQMHGVSPFRFRTGRLGNRGACRDGLVGTTRARHDSHAENPGLSVETAFSTRRHGAANHLSRKKPSLLCGRGQYPLRRKGNIAKPVREQGRRRASQCVASSLAALPQHFRMEAGPIVTAAAREKQTEISDLSFYLSEKSRDFVSKSCCFGANSCGFVPKSCCFAALSCDIEKNRAKSHGCRFWEVPPAGRLHHKLQFFIYKLGTHPNLLVAKLYPFVYCQLHLGVASDALIQ